VNLLAPGRNLVLIGLMGVGKTTVGRLLAKRLGRPFADTDLMIESEVGQPIAEIFATAGERTFRTLEAAAVRRVSALRGQLIAVGGGAVTIAGNVTHLRSTGDLVLLDADAQTLSKRLVGGAETSTRPLLTDAHDLAARLADLRARRDAAYRGAASYTVDTSTRTPEEVADEVLTWARRCPGLLTREEMELWT
jgi:shikimate kinase